MTEHWITHVGFDVGNSASGAGRGSRTRAQEYSFKSGGVFPAG